MSKIDEQLQKLKEHEKKLFTEKLKIEFLNHILTSVEGYNEKAFEEVKQEVYQLVKLFVTKTTEAIETGTTIEYAPTKPAQVVESQVAPVAAPAKPKVDPTKVAEAMISPADKMNFALEHRHLAGKMVTVANDQNLTIRGKVVGLDFPVILVSVDGGPTIRVPRDKVSLA